MEPVEIQIARLDERYKNIQEKMEQNEKTNIESAATLRRLESVLDRISTRIEDVEVTLASAKPTINEYINFKHKVIGAGTFGKWVWLVAGALLSYVLTIREHLTRFLSGG